MQNEQHPMPMKNNAYRNFAAMLTVSFIIMYGVMFLNVDDTSHIYLSNTRAYMALLMVAPMALLKLAFMKHMYRNAKKNTAIVIGSIAVMVLAFTALRTQAFISDVQYMKAMIPHHSSAIMTSSNANIKDPEVKKLSEQIIKSQEEEIAQMKQMLNRIENQ
ncbi:DUF305 domain-containing protein [Flavobacterium sp. RHBU_24]|uniref:DUF305 domain-containing protein n=1 Tax=Flavobacterium sp. RHBU_24 TaxID=3391185 RepID=UPI0039854017